MEEGKQGGRKDGRREGRDGEDRGRREMEGRKEKEGKERRKRGREEPEVLVSVPVCFLVSKNQFLEHKVKFP